MSSFEERTENKFNDLDGRVRTLEVKDAKDDGRIDLLYDKMDQLVETIDKWMIFAQALYWKVLGAAGGLISILALFFVWYIQSLPR